MPLDSMDDYFDTTDLHPTDMIVSSMLSWDMPSTADREYYADWHSDYSKDYITPTKSDYINSLKERAFHALSLSKRR